MAGTYAWWPCCVFRCWRSAMSTFCSTTERTGGSTKGNAPHCTPRRRPNPPCFMHLYRRVLTRSRPTESPKANQLLAHLALLVGPGALALPPSNCAKIAGAGGADPPPPAPTPEGFLVASPQMERGAMAIAADIRIPLFVFFCVLGPLFFRSPLYRLVLTRSRCALQLPKANQLLAHLALLVGPEALALPPTQQLRKNRRGGGGADPPPARHLPAGLCPA
jgi:hypothetical protein